MSSLLLNCCRVDRLGSCSCSDFDGVWSELREVQLFELVFYSTSGRQHFAVLEDLCARNDLLVISLDLDFKLLEFIVLLFQQFCEDCTVRQELRLIVLIY